MREKIVIKYKKNIGIVAKGRMTDEHLHCAITSLRAVEIERRNNPPKRRGVVKTIRKFFYCLYKSVQPTPRVQHVTCKMPLMFEWKQ